ncbi:MAG: beta-propeller fold lactonase family protein [Clostridiales bacterium]|nr:beta-propeller fold lactonase family protein [Clostridiales bacterium]
MSDKYVAYVGSYTDTNTSKGLTVFDVDPENNYLTKRLEYTVHNASYITTSYDKRFLYSITDLGVTSFLILPGGNLKKLNTAPIRGMRGCHISLNRANTYMFVSGYYDGKITVLRMNPDGSVGKISDAIFHRGPGTIAERNFRPHIRCAALTPDEKYLFVVDSGIDQVKIYRFDEINGTLHGIDTIHCKLEAGPRFVRFSSDGRFFYSIKEILNTISVYEYSLGPKGPQYKMIQTISTLGPKFSDFSAAVYFRFTDDEKYLLCSNAGDNSVGVFRRDTETGLLEQLNVLPISGKYPTSIQIFPDGNHIFCTNYDSSTITFFTINYEKGLLVENGAPMAIDQPNCSLLMKVPDYSDPNPMP